MPCAIQVMKKRKQKPRLRPKFFHIFIDVLFSRCIARTKVPTRYAVTPTITRTTTNVAIAPLLIATALPPAEGPSNGPGSCWFLSPKPRRTLSVAPIRGRTVHYRGRPLVRAHPAPPPLSSLRLEPRPDVEARYVVGASRRAAKSSQRSSSPKTHWTGHCTPSWSFPFRSFRAAIPPA